MKQHDLDALFQKCYLELKGASIIKLILTQQSQINEI